MIFDYALFSKGLGYENNHNFMLIFCLFICTYESCSVGQVDLGIDFLHMPKGDFDLLRFVCMKLCTFAWTRKVILWCKYGSKQILIEKFYKRM